MYSALIPLLCTWGHHHSVPAVSQSVPQTPASLPAHTALGTTPNAYIYGGALTSQAYGTPLTGFGTTPAYGTYGTYGTPSYGGLTGFGTTPAYGSFGTSYGAVTTPTYGAYGAHYPSIIMTPDGYTNPVWATPSTGNLENIGYASSISAPSSPYLANMLQGLGSLTAGQYPAYGANPVSAQDEMVAKAIIYEHFSTGGISTFTNGLGGVLGQPSYSGVYPSGLGLPSQTAHAPATTTYSTYASPSPFTQTSLSHGLPLPAGGHHQFQAPLPAGGHHQFQAPLPAGGQHQFQVPLPQTSTPQTHWKAPLPSH
eukprot:NODE_3062_length_1038_cov_33.397366_g2919_i0.p1 GENE.NODE_3062_length_1038_cov_33.397366_g2919_i0~~NODE_3062_length_1038_cov_33.397366_g2919_i0.p1  ORF type:complete len:311 (+),score=18.30 NODE_3062_length_1038_cov_33.397366_g2919_i0:2-934(+)